MKRLILALLTLMLLPIAAWSQSTTVTGHLLNPDGSAPANGKVCFTLQGYKPNTPRVVGSGTVIQERNFCVAVSTTDGSFSTSLFGGAIITPANTYWRVDFFNNGIQQSSASYLISGTSYNLDSATPITTAPAATPITPTAVSRVFQFTQAVAATTWTIAHNFGTTAVVVQFFDGNGKQIFPDTVTITDANTVTATFVVAQAGTATVMNSTNFSQLSNASSVVVTNPTANQAITGGFNLSSNGQISDTGGTHTGTETFKAADTVAYIDAGNPQGWAGSDIGGWMNAAYASLSPGGTIFVGAGAFNFSTQIALVGKPVTVKGAGCTIAQNGSTPLCATRLTWTGGANVAIDVGAFVSTPDLTARGTILRDFGLDNTGTGTIGVRINTVGEPKLLNFIVYPFTGSSVSFSTSGVVVGDITTGGGQVNDFLCRDCYIRAQTDGLQILNVSEATVEHSRILQNSGNQIKLGDATHIANNIQIIGGTNFSNLPNVGTGDAAGAGIKIIRAPNILNIIDSYCEDQGTNALCVDASAITGGNLNMVNIERTYFTWSLIGNKPNFAASVNLAGAQVNSIGNTFDSFGTAGIHEAAFAQGLDINNFLKDGTPSVFDSTTNVAQIYGSSAIFNALRSVGMTISGPGLSVTAGGATVVGGTNSDTYKTTTNCNVNSVSPAACGSAASGSVVVPTTTTTYTVNTTAVTANSRIIITPITDNSGLSGGPTCNAPPTPFVGYESGRSAGTSFTFTLPSTTGTSCWTFWIIN